MFLTEVLLIVVATENIWPTNPKRRTTKLSFLENVLLTSDTEEGGVNTEVSGRFPEGVMSGLKRRSMTRCHRGPGTFCHFYCYSFSRPLCTFLHPCLLSRECISSGFYTEGTKYGSENAPLT